MDMYPGGCHALQEGNDGWLTNDLRCTLDVLISVAIKTWPPNQHFDTDMKVWVDDAAEKWQQNPKNQNVRRESVTTDRGFTLELIRYEFDYSNGTPGTKVSAFFRHHDGSLFRIGMHYAVKNETQNAPIVDFALKTFSVLD